MSNKAKDMELHATRQEVHRSASAGTRQCQNDIRGAWQCQSTVKG